jgi:predicted AAA+ superfamily ATPase
MLEEKGSILLFGPRMVGKTSLLERLSFRRKFNLLEPELELQLRTRPSLLLKEVSSLSPGDRVLIDEVQKVPELLNVVQSGIDQLKLDFVLSGSSARKLRRGGGNLLGGRALDRKLYPLTQAELGSDFDLERTLMIGTLPKVVTEGLSSLDRAYDYLHSYTTTYIKEEIQAEALVRNVGAFQRFLPIAAQSHGQTIEFENIARESSNPASTVKEYFQILEDTLVGFFLWPHDRKERKKARPKFYFFDPGVARALQGRLGIAIEPREKGILFESWLIQELVRINEYKKLRLEFSFWRERSDEVDLLIFKGGKPFLGVEIKTGKEHLKETTRKKFLSRFPGVPLFVVTNTPGVDGSERDHYLDFLNKFRS